MFDVFCFCCNICVYLFLKGDDKKAKDVILGQTRLVKAAAKERNSGGEERAPLLPPSLYLTRAGAGGQRQVGGLTERLWVSV